MGDDFDAYLPSLEDWGGLLSDDTVKELAEEQQLEYMEAWFRHLFEDPANETPYESAEGGYQYVWGGPYDHRDQLYDQFGDVVSEALIERLAQRLDGYGHEWAPTSNHPNRDDDRAEEQVEEAWNPDLDELVRELEQGVELHFDDRGGPLRTAIEERLGALEQVVAELQHGAIGHNQPPESIEAVQALEAGHARDIATAMAVVRVEIVKERPDALAVAKAGVRFRDIGKWLAEKLDKAADEAFKVVGKGVGTAVLTGATVAALGGWHHLAGLLAEAARTIAVWIALLTSPF